MSDAPLCDFCGIRPCKFNRMNKRYAKDCGENECKKLHKSVNNRMLIQSRKANGLVLVQDRGVKQWVTPAKRAEIVAARPPRKGRIKTKNFTCIVPGCIAPAKAKNFCQTHYEYQRQKRPDWNRVKRQRRPNGVVADETVSARPSRQVMEAFSRACLELDVTKHNLLNQILSLWERQYRAGGYVNPLSPGNIIDPQAFYSTQRHMR